MTDRNKSKPDRYEYPLDEMQVGDSWRMFRILAEFVEGFDLLSSQEPMVSVFGASRAGADDPYYQKACELGGKLANAGIAVITGGGPGIMEAVNKGAFDAGGKSIGVEIDLPQEKEGNRYTNQKIRVRYFFVRKVMLIKYSQAFVIFPGGYGTLDEMFEALTLIKTGRILPFPIILMGSEFWKDAMAWITANVINSGYAEPDALDIITITDDLDEAIAICRNSIAKSIKSEWIAVRRK